MTIKVYNFGACDIQVNTGFNGAGVLNDTWETLGYTEGGVMVREEPVTVPIHGDHNGGSNGEPIDFFYLGDTHTLSCALTSLDSDVLGKLVHRFRRGSPSAAGGLNNGVIHPRGILVGKQTFMVLLESRTITDNHRRYLRVFMNSPDSFTLGTRFIRAEIVLTAFPKTVYAGGKTYETIWDNVITAVPPAPPPPP